MSDEQAEWKVTTDDTSKATNVGNFLKVEFLLTTDRGRRVYHESLSALSSCNIIDLQAKEHE
eukprot:1194423-Prorocentrum_minimum.AAC.4